jgi:hypothetical protein
MKISNLTRKSHDIHENKGSCSRKRVGRKQRMQKKEKIASRFARASGIAERPREGMNAPKRSARQSGVSLTAAHFLAGQEKRCSINTFKAGMCLKTKSDLTSCPKIKRHFRGTFRYLTQTERYFAEFCRNRQPFCQSYSILAGTRCSGEWLTHSAEGGGRRERLTQGYTPVRIPGALGAP